MVNSALPVKDFDFKIDKKTKATISNNSTAVLQETDFKVLVKLLGIRIPGKPRPGVDLVAVLDVSGSMGPDLNTAHEDRLAKLKIAMQFVIKKLSPIDRLAVVIFNASANRVFELRPITESSLTEIENIIEKLIAKGGTDILAGLEEGLNVLKEIEQKVEPSGRMSGIILMSDGDNKDYNKEKLSQMDVRVPVHTFGIGDGFRPEILQAITKKKVGGTFSAVQRDNLSISFSMCLAGLLSVAVKDLTLTLTAVPTKSEINKDKVFAGDYPKKEVPGSSVTVEFGDLYDQELRTVLVDLHLPPAVLPAGDSEVGANVLKISYTLSAEGGKTFKSAPRIVNITRVGTVALPELPDVEHELQRLHAVGKIKEAIAMAEETRFKDALGVLEETQDYLKNAAGGANPLTKALLSDLSQLVQYMADQGIYENHGRAYAFSLETSHDCQRCAARGDEVKKGGLYSTPRMDAYIEQARSFPATPVPRADEDEKNEDEQRELADPRGATARALSLHINTTTESLKTIINSLKAIESIIY